MRKDVECCFGILKGRWRILKYGVRFWKLKQCDQLWLTCCSLHNMLLEVDGLAKSWEKGEKSPYEVDNDDTDDLPFAMKRLLKPGQKMRDTASMGYGNDVDIIPSPSKEQSKEMLQQKKYNKDSNGQISVCEMSLNDF